MLELATETDLLPVAAEEAVDAEAKYDLSPPKAIFSPSPNHPLHTLVSMQCVMVNCYCVSVELWS